MNEQVCFKFRETGEGSAKEIFSRGEGEKETAFAGSQKETVEEWRTVQGYQGRYEVSNLGRVRTNSGRQKNPNQGGIINLRLHPTGYSEVNLWDSEKQEGKRTKVSRLVAYTFIENPQQKPHVNHINGVKTDNRVENLEWVTSGENNRHAYRTGLRRRLLGEESPVSKLTSDQVLKLRRLANEGISRKELQSIFGLSKAGVRVILTRRTWSHLP